MIFFYYLKVRKLSNIMEKLKEIKDLVEKMSVDTDKAMNRGSRSAAIRARKYAQQLKELITPFRKEILENFKEK